MKTGLFKLSTKDLATLSERVIDISQKPAYAVVDGHPLYLKVLESHAAYDQVYTKKGYSGLGKDVADSDTLCDLPFRGMRGITHDIMVVDGMSNQQDAADIYSIFEEFGIDMDTLSYSSQNAQMKKLIERLDLPVNQAKLEKVHLTEMYGIMKVNYHAFLEIFDKQTEINAGLRLQQTASSLRNTLETDLRAYLNYVDVMSGFDSRWTPLKAELEEVLKAARSSNLPPK